MTTDADPNTDPIAEKAQDAASTLVFVDLGLTEVTGEEQCARAVDIIAKRIAAAMTEAVEAERESCAKVAEQYGAIGKIRDVGACNIAERIRQRSREQK